MKPWDVIGRARTADGTELTLWRHVSGFVIKADGQNLMSSRLHGSEEALAALGCAHARAAAEPQVLIGGLGMGYTLRAALDLLPSAARVIVAELVPEVVQWNRGPLSELAGHPLRDARVEVAVADVAAVLRGNPGRFDAVLLDVDNGPEALTAASNDSLYGDRGIATVRAALKADGVLAVWSAWDDRRFERRLRTAGFTVRREHARARTRPDGRTTRGTARHTIVLAQRGPAAVVGAVVTPPRSR